MTEGEGVRVEMTRFASDGGVRLSLGNVGRPGKKNGVDTSGRRIPGRLVARLISCEGCGERAVFQVTVHEREEENKREDMPLSHESRVIRVAAFRLKGGSGGNLLGEGDNQRAQRSGARL
jgi:hypothetical protein